MKKTLVILAAGIGSRFGGGIKQLEPIDDYGHIIIDYSIHDAIAAGFQKIVFIIRHDIEADFREVIGERIEAVVTSVSGTNFSDISFKIKGGSPLNIEKYGIFKVNTEMPDYSYDLMDATGRYLWREPLSDSALTVDNELYDSIFTNGAHYRHLNINFYLRRQDPIGEYGLNEDSTLDYKTGAAGGQIKDVSVAEYEEEKAGDIC